MNKGRVYYFDILRIVAILAVILLHVSGSHFRTVDIHSDDWHAFNVYESVSRFGVALFTMISGALFLSGTKTIGRILKKNVVRIAVAFFVWSAIYLLVLNEVWSVPTVVRKLFCGHFHMWYLYAIIGLYLLVPILRVIVENEKLTRYFLVLCFLFAFVLPQLVSVVSLYSYTLGEIGRSVLGNVNLQFVMGLTGYFVLGYWFHHHELSGKMIRLLYAGAVFAFGLNIIGTIAVSYHQNVANTIFYETMSVTTLIQAMAIFVWFRQHFGERDGQSAARRSVIEKLSISTFGVYLVHPLWMELMDRHLGLNTLSFTAWLSVPALFAMVLVISVIVSLILNQIPLVKKCV